MAQLFIRALGSLQVTLRGNPVTGIDSDKVRGLLVYLAVKATDHTPVRSWRGFFGLNMLNAQRVPTCARLWLIYGR